mmetsp:Transcript_8528/g.38755  ORF Transcript_8528/g.38755 Transcript_8528/m.38755 type:complete len:219 (+) Transcript_8528:1529-2185(+)
MECGDLSEELSGEARSPSFFGDIFGVPSPFRGDRVRAASRSISSAHSCSASAAAMMARSPTSAAARHDAASPVAVVAAASALRVSISLAAPMFAARRSDNVARSRARSNSSSIAFRSALSTLAARSNSSARCSAWMHRSRSASAASPSSAFLCSTPAAAAAASSAADAKSSQVPASSSSRRRCDLITAMRHVDMHLCNVASLRALRSAGDDAASTASA